LRERLVGRPVKVVDTLGDGAGIRGFVHTQWPGEPSDAYLEMLVTLAGPIASAKTFDEIPSWPLDPSVEGSDEARLAELSEHLKLDERGYRRVVRDALNLSCTSAFEQLFTAVTGMLTHVPVMSSDLLEQVIEISEQR
jgi:hypothetical protein